MLSAFESLPPELLAIILDELLLVHAHSATRGRSCGVALSTTSRLLRAKSFAWLFSEVNNSECVWPRTLWPHIVKVHIRGLSATNVPLAATSPALYHALASMPALTHVSIDIDVVLPPEMMSTLATLNSLYQLAIERVRLDGPATPLHLPFPSLSRLLLRVRAPYREPNIDTERENANVLALLCAVSDKLVELTISGDLLTPPFTQLEWERLKCFTVTDHPPFQSIPIHSLVGHMHRLSTLELLFTADFRVANRRLPPFTLDYADNSLSHLPELSTFACSNLDSGNAIFQHLPQNLQTLRLLALWDYHDRIPVRYDPLPIGSFGEHVMPTTDVARLLSGITSANLTSLCITLLSDLRARKPIIGALPAVIERVPALRSLELRYRPYDYTDMYFVDFVGMQFFSLLQPLRHLAHLTLFLIYYIVEENPGPPGHGAHSLLKYVSPLQTVTYKFAGYRDATLGSPLVYCWDKSMLRDPRPPRVIREPPLIVLECYSDDDE
ncbi:hypothetical protein MIND_00659400 [Mycena indigotica]|uniref:Uncharacterized protein n=1 Tax=Mycena indigotica TaxID=2126181 RepID=A0A8H6W429_9AGAR|nr:uncharacterized protein MIND_00659400 [Mycena indigotica]KAF7300963.1 hypothetical protein MIND_00659400 [Mycena indigotica]